METHTPTQTQTLLPSPTSSSSSSNNTNIINNTTTTNNNNKNMNNNGMIPTTPKQQQQQQQIPVTRSETNPYPTTFVQADTSSFKQVVQMLTGSSESTPKSSKPGNPIPPIKTPNKSKPSKLYERRSTSLKNLRHHHHNSLNRNFNNNGSNNNNAEILSPSLLDFPSLVLSPVTPLIHDPFNRSPISSSSSPSPNIVVDKFAEDKAIADKAFFLHPSPVSTPRDSEPRLLTLFPLTSPRSDSTS
ncbi:VQ motif-containing protein 4 [Bienertia sinuspersici]